WSVSASDLRCHLPTALDPVVDNDCGWLSAVIFRNRALRPARIGVPRVRPLQMNLRTYVRSPHSSMPGSVFFHGLFLSQRWLARLSSQIFGVSFQHLAFAIDVQRDGERVVRWNARSRDGALDVMAEESDVAVDRRLLDLLTNPHTGYVLDRRGPLK